MPFTPRPVALNTDPANGYFDSSSSGALNLAVVMYNSSILGPPKQQDVVLRAGICNTCSSAPVIEKHRGVKIKFSILDVKHLEEWGTAR